jgi:Histidine kinase-, DNA gyrase B-, and HSP90-like ATPase
MKPQKVIEKRDEYFAYGSVLEAISQGLYPDRKHILREFVQNAYDALADLRRQRPRGLLAPVEITVAPPSLIIADKGIGMSEATMIRYRYLGFSAKELGTHAGFRGIGKFSAISVCDRLIVRSSKLGDPKSYQVEIDAAGMWSRLKDEKNPPLETLLREHSQINEVDEDPDQHYTFVELHSIHKDASNLLDQDVIEPYLIQAAPLPFDPDFTYSREISERLHQIDPRFLEVELRLNGKPIYKPFLAKGSRPDYKEVFAQDGSSELLAFAWFCQHTDKGQFREASDGESRGRRHPYSGLHYRVSNFAIGDSTLARKSLWHTTPERAYYFFGEIHIMDSGVIPTSDRDNFEDTSARGRLYERCREIAITLSFRAGLESQQRRFTEVVAKGQELVSATEAELQNGKVETELKEDKEYQIQRLLEDLGKRLKQSGHAKQRNERVVKQAKRVLRRAERLRRTLRSNGDGQHQFVDISKELKMDPKTKALYETIIAVLREEFRQEPQRFAALVRRIHDALRTGVPC